MIHGRNNEAGLRGRGKKLEEEKRDSDGIWWRHRSWKDWDVQELDERDNQVYGNQRVRSGMYGRGGKRGLGQGRWQANVGYRKESGTAWTGGKKKRERGSTEEGIDITVENIRKGKENNRRKI